MMHHLGSLSLTRVTAEGIFVALSELFDSLGLPWDNLVSVLMDSCNVMRGSKAGVEVKIRDKAPHLLDIDGDSCHHAHNAAKKFCAEFDGKVERLLTDVHTDFKWCADHKEILADLCRILGVHSTAPKRYVPHRWLSVHDVTVDTLQMIDAITLFYFSFLSPNDQDLYRDVVDDILQRCVVGKKAGETVQNFQKVLSRKKVSFTEEGKARKKRICELLFITRQQTLLTMNLYCAVLPSLKKYVKLFQGQKPIVHTLMFEQRKLVEDFFSLFVKPSALLRENQKLLKSVSEESVSEKEELKSYLKSVDLDKPQNLQPLALVFVGKAAENILKAEHKKRPIVSEAVKTDFLKTVRTAYVSCGKSLQSKMPLENRNLVICQALDPQLRCSTATLQQLLKLPSVVKSLDDSDDFRKEARSYTSSQTLTLQADRIDQWWGDLEVTYPLLCKGAQAMLSCFHGPLVESNFSAMSDILDSQSARTSIETYSATQCVRTHLSARGMTAVQLFGKKNPLAEPVNMKLNKNFKNARSVNHQKQKAEREKEKMKRENLGVGASKPKENSPSAIGVKNEPAKGKVQRPKNKSAEQNTNNVGKQRKPDDRDNQIVREKEGHDGGRKDRKAFFSNLAMKLEGAAKSSFYDLQCLAKKAEQHVLGYTVECSNSLQVEHYHSDAKSVELYPEDAPDLVPVEIFGDGNCLPRSASLLMCETQNSHQEMRARIVVELAAHENFYLDNRNLQGTPPLSQTLDLTSNSCMTKSYAVYSDHFCMQPLNFDSIKDIFRREVCTATVPGSEMGIWQLHAVASILRRPLVSIYPSFVSHSVRKDLHRQIQPRIMDDKSAVVPAIMWTRLGSDLPENVWRPNHFVVCLPKRSQDGGLRAPRKFFQDHYLAASMENKPEKDHPSTPSESLPANPKKRKGQACGVDIRDFFGKRPKPHL
eukprot:TRINITY_DN50875_c0_g1_i4.p1 TRINITY_DN50875_c0_g1~~TRINITY_DN50875_c0_g1_i4.p1  ORF type:complete len:932 (+),score=185.05 TRINITY_DN50875_c0_g1_i4:61-2856(+)